MRSEWVSFPRVHCPGPGIAWLTVSHLGPGPVDHFAPGSVRPFLIPHFSDSNLPRFSWVHYTILNKYPLYAQDPKKSARTRQHFSQPLKDHFYPAAGLFLSLVSEKETGQDQIYVVPNYLVGHSLWGGRKGGGGGGGERRTIWLLNIYSSV